ncbi:MAG: Gfo/Idh/MocA family oxidoreductase [Spirochaetes bacterium]|nr:Gfo/Idh/MocA family oxidoreductase [Spirochaetota bacterium]
MKKIKIGQIGVCHEHAVKISTIRRMTDIFEVVGVVDDRASSSAKFAGSDLTPYEGLPWMTEKELFNYPGLQAVTVETPNGDLVPTSIRCMEHGLPVHMDKPGGEDITLFGKLLTGCRKKNLPFQMGYMFRNNPAMQFCLKAVREHWLGDIFEVQAGMSHNYGGDAYQTYLGNFKGGIMFNLGCHLIDLVVAMLGRPEKITPFLKTAPGTADGIHNNCLSVLEYPHATVTLRACSVEVDGLNSRRLKICGTKGTIDLCPLERFDGKPLELRMTLRDGNTEYAAGTHTVDFGIQQDRYMDQFLELAKILNGEMKNPYTYEHDYLVQEVVLAAAGYTGCRK